MRGDIPGLDGIGTDHHGPDAIRWRIPKSVWCAIRQRQNVSRGACRPAAHLHKSLSKEIVRDNNVMLSLAACREERLACSC